MTSPSDEDAAQPADRTRSGADTGAAADDAVAGETAPDKELAEQAFRDTLAQISRGLTF